MSHQHRICADHERLVLEGKHERGCCQCNGLNDCGDSINSLWTSSSLKRLNEEKAILKAQREPDIGEDGFIPEEG